MLAKYGAVFEETQDDALRSLKRFAKKSDAKAWYQLYRNTHQMACLEQAAELGHIKAQFELADMLMTQILYNSEKFLRGSRKE